MVFPLLPSTVYRLLSTYYLILDDWEDLHVKVLITGGSGMLGRVLVRRLSEKEVVTAVSKSGREGTVVCDLVNEKALEALFCSTVFDVVIHTAAYSDVDGCENNPGLAHESNALATKFLSRLCGLKKIPFIYVSTDYVFDGRKRSPYAESDKTCPVNVYGLTKLEGEYYARSYPAFSVIVRTSWLFGAGNPRNFVNAIADRLRSEKTVRVLDDQEDAPTYVTDLSEALERAAVHLVSLFKKNPGGGFKEIFHVCNAGKATRLEMTLKIKEVLGLKNVSVERMDRSEIQNRAAVRPAYAVMSTRHYEDFFRCRMRPWEESLKEYLSAGAVCVS